MPLSGNDWGTVGIRGNAAVLDGPRDLLLRRARRGARGPRPLPARTRAVSGSADDGRGDLGRGPPAARCRATRACSPPVATTRTASPGKCGGTGTASYCTKDCTIHRTPICPLDHGLREHVRLLRGPVHPPLHRDLGLRRLRVPLDRSLPGWNRLRAEVGRRRLLLGRLGLHEPELQRQRACSCDVPHRRRPATTPTARRARRGPRGPRTARGPARPTATARDTAASAQA